MKSEDKIEIEALTPMEELDPRNPGFKIYRDALTSAFKNPKIRNLALSGSLGSGKSSIIRSFDRERNGRKRFLYVSLIDFSKAISAAEGTKYDQRQLEHSLLTQILSYCKADDLPEGSIRGIPEKLPELDAVSRYLTLLFLAMFMLVFHEKFGALAAVFGVPEYLCSNMHLGLYGFAAIALCGFLYHSLMRWLPAMRISKVQLKSGVAEAEVDLSKEPTSLDTHKFELAYILEQIGENHDHTVVFEDLERLDSAAAVAIMTKLRELNNLTNNHLRSQLGEDFQPIRFLYAIGDSTMPVPYRTKFYDCIIPVSPVAHPLNSGDKFRSLLKVGSIWDDALCDALCDAFVDYRSLLSLKNEFHVLRALCKETSGPRNEAFLLAVTAYKLLLPEWFERALSPQGDGILPDFSDEQEREALIAHLEKHDRMKALTAVDKLFATGLLGKFSLRLIVGDDQLIGQWLTVIRSTLMQDHLTPVDEERTTNLIDALEEAHKGIRLNPNQEPYADFRSAMTQQLHAMAKEKLTDEDKKRQFVLLVNSLSAVSRKGVQEDWAWSDHEDIAKHYNTCLDHIYHTQRASLESGRNRFLRTLRENSPKDQKAALRYATSLFNLASIQKLPELNETIALLEKLHQTYPENQKIAHQYANGLINLSAEQKLEGCVATVDLLKKLRETYPENQEFALTYAMGLFNLSYYQELESCVATVDLLKKLHEAYPENQEIALVYAKDLVNLSARQELEGRIATVDLLKKLYEAYPENQEIAHQYAMGLVNLSVEQKLEGCVVTIDLLMKLYEAYPDNQEIALVYAKDLVNLSAKQELEGRAATVDFLQKLHEAYPENQEIALEYAKGLFNLSIKQKLPELADTLNLLKKLHEAYPENEEIALRYIR